MFDAALRLDRLRRELPNDPALAREVNLLLGACYEKLGDLERRLAAYRRALPVDSTDPLWVPALLGVAEAEAALGQLVDALASYRRLKDQAPEAWVQVARLEMIRTLRDADDKRDWRPVEEAVAAAEQALPGNTDVDVLRVDLLHHQGRPAVARQKLDALRAAKPKEAAVWVALATQDARDKDLKRAAETLAAGEREAGDAPELRLARARLWAEANEPDLPNRLAELAAGAEKFGETRRLQLLRSLAVVATAAGVTDTAARLRDQAAALRPDDLGAQLGRFDRAILVDDKAGIESALAAVRRLDGVDGPSSRLARVHQIIREAQKENRKDRLPEALVLLDGLARERDGWSRVKLAQALALDLQGNPDAALPRYQQAVELGEASPQALRRLMELLAAKGRTAEADDVLRRLPAASAAGADAQRLMAEVSLGAANTPENQQRALEHAAKAVSATSTDPTDHIWLGRVYLRTGKKGEAEAPFRKAAQLRPEASDGWLVLIDYLTQVDRRDEAAKVLDDARGKVAQTERALFAGLAHARLGEADRAAEAFRQARAERPADLRTLQAQAEFLFRAGRLAEAQKAFEEVKNFPTASAEDRDYGRRMLALSLAVDRDFQTSRRALEVLGVTPAGEAPVQRRCGRWPWPSSGIWPASKRRYGCSRGSATNSPRTTGSCSPRPTRRSATGPRSG